MNSTKTTKTTTTEANKAKRQARKKTTAEDFTPSWLVNQMLDKLEKYSPNCFSYHPKTVLDPAAGNGNLLIPFLQRKLKYLKQNNKLTEKTSCEALAAIFGCDIMKDNVDECRLRLLKVIIEFIESLKEFTWGQRHEMYRNFIKIVASNIVCTPLNKYPNGSLDYLSLPEDRTFNHIMSEEQAEKTLITIVNKKLFDKVSI